MEGISQMSFFSLDTIEVVILAFAIISAFLVAYLFFSRRARKRMNTFLLNALAQEQDQLIVFFDFNAKVVFANKSFQELTGLSHKKMVGKKFSSLPINKELINGFLENNDKIQEWKSSSIQYSLSIEKDGKSESFQIQKRRLTLDSKKENYILTVASNTSKRKLFEERLSVTQGEYQQLVESARDIIFKVDLKGNFNFVNSVVEQTLGYREAEFLSMNFKDLVFEEDYERVNSFYEKQVLKNEPSTYLEFRVKTKSGGIKWLGQSVSFIKENKKVSGFQSVTRDITAAKDTEKHLKQAKEIAEQTSKTKSGFIASMSHEFRTPLNAILGYTQILYNSDSLQDSEKEQISAIAEGGEQLLSMVTDILELSTLDSDSSKVDSEMVALQPFMKDLAVQFSKKAQSKGLSFSFKKVGVIPEIIVVDVDKVSTIVKNLLSNAVKFTPQGDVSFSVGIKDKTLKVQIVDTGIGISKKVQEQIFQPFWQLDSMKNDGTGLGLTLSKRLSEFLGGSIQLKSTEGKGTSVSVEIPIEISSENVNIPLKDSVNSSVSKSKSVKEKIKVLIVDDVEANRTITRIILQENGYDFMEAEDGLQALNLLKAYDPDIILMDINMPVMDGLEAMLTIRASSERHGKIPIIAVTAGGFKGDRTELMEQGFSEYILKPFKAEEIIGSIKSLLKIQDSIDHDSVLEELEVSSVKTPESVVKFVLSLSEEKIQKIEKLLKMQDLGSLAKIGSDKDFMMEVGNPNLIQLTKAANDYDYLFLNKVQKDLSVKKA